MATLIVQVKNGVGQPIHGVQVQVTQNSATQTKPTVDGIVTFPVQQGLFCRVIAAKDWFLPETISHEGKVEGEETRIEFTLNEVRFYLHVDGDRDGLVDDDRTGIDTWTWGTALQGGKGAVVMCNVDDDPPRGQPRYDCDDAVVNAAPDNVEIAPLQIRRHGIVAAPVNWTLRLEITNNNHRNVRIFDGVGTGAQQVAGPGAPAYLVPHVDTIDRLNYGMEAIHFADYAWHGYAHIQLTVSKNNSVGGGPIQYSSRAEVRVAPWLMPSQDHDANTVYMVNAGNGPTGNTVIRADVSNLVQNVQNLAFVLHPSNDRWMQDCMEIGYSTLPIPNTTHRMDCVIKAHRTGALATYPETLRTRDFGYVTPARHSPRGPTTFDSLGNLECTPPVRSRAPQQIGDPPQKNYPWGRIYYGEGTNYRPFNRYMEDFLRRQTVQAPIRLMTQWLAVGHVDEAMTFLPFPTGPQWKQWKLLVASPTQAYDILDNLDAANLDLPMMVGRQFKFSPGTFPVATTVRAFLNGNTVVRDLTNTNHFVTSGWLRNYNTVNVEGHITAMLNELRQEIDLDVNTDVIRVPVIFTPADVNANACLALTADLVNMLVLNGLCIAPRAFGPIDNSTGVAVDKFEEDLENSLTNAYGVNIPALHFLDDWDSYHRKEGEVHCGTNTWRYPPNLNNWLTSPTARWWEFLP